SNMWICVASRRPNSVPFSVTVSSTRSARACASVIGMLKSWCATLALHRAVAVDPVAERGGQQAAQDSGPGDGGNARRNRTERCAEISDDEQRYEPGEAVVADPVAR